MPHAAKANTTGPRIKTPPKVKPPIERTPQKFTYALRQWTVAKPDWRGPFATIESACLAIARGLALELADRHTKSVEHYNIGRKHPLYGFKPETRV